MDKKDAAPELRGILDRAFNHSYVTLEDLNSRMETIDQKFINADVKLDSSANKLKIWILVAFITVISSVVGTYISMVEKLDRLNEALPAITRTLEARRPWFPREELRNDRQDRSLQNIDPKYQPMPYREPPE